MVAPQVEQAVVVGPGDVDGADPDGPRRRLDQTRETPHEGRLAAAGQAHHDEHLARRGVEVDLAHGDGVAGAGLQFAAGKISGGSTDDALGVGPKTFHNPLTEIALALSSPTNGAHVECPRARPLRTVVLARSSSTRPAVLNDGVGIVGYRLVRWLRSTLRSSALMVAVVAVVASVPLALAAGARRTGSAPERYVRALPVPLDVKANQEEGPSLEREIATLPAVRAVRSVTFVFGVISPGGPEQALDDGLVFAGSAAATGDQVVAGREPDHGRRDEFVASKDYAEEHGFSLGDTMHLYTLTPKQAAEEGFDTDSPPEEPTVDGVLVGLVDGPADLSDPTGTVVFGTSLLDDAQIATSGSEYGIDLADGASIDDLRVQLDGIDGGELLRLEPSAAVGPEVRRAIDAQALSLWILAGLAGLVTIAGLGQLLVRHTRLSAAETSALSSLGATRAQFAGETAARAGVIAAVAAAVAAVVALAGSGIFPFGFVRDVEPDRGPHGDALVLALGAVVLVLGMVGWVVVMTRFRRSAAPSRRPAGVDAIAARCPTSAMATGVRFAITSRDATSRLGGVVLMAAGVVGTLVFAVSVERLVAEPARYGVNYDAQIDDGSEQISPDQRAVLETDPAIADVNYYRSSMTRVEGTGATLALAGVERVRGLLDPPLLAGRLPAGPEEIAVGRISADRLGASIGDVLTLFSPAGDADFEITGLIVPPLIRGNDQVGVGGLVTSAGYRRLDPDVGPQSAVFRLRPDPSPDDVERLTAVFGEPPDPSPPPTIRNEARTTYVPFVLAVLLAVLTVILVVSGAYTAVRHRNHEVAVMRSLGAERNWLVRVVNWLAVTSTLVPAVIGVPLGFIVGRLVFRAYADGLGTVNSAVTPALIVALGIGLLVLLAAVAATTAGRTARRLVPAQLLHVE